MNRLTLNCHVAAWSIFHVDSRASPRSPTVTLLHSVIQLFSERHFTTQISNETGKFVRT